jgi:hypothetical protein
MFGNRLEHHQRSVVAQPDIHAGERDSRGPGDQAGDECPERPVWHERLRLSEQAGEEGLGRMDVVPV